MVHTPLQPFSQIRLDPSPLPIESFGPISLLVLQGTSLCNLNCDYCYLPDRHLKNQISLDLLEPIFEKVFTSRFLERKFTVCWHAGEPLTLPIKFYEAALAKIEDLSEKYNHKKVDVSFAIQTNGTLINQSWCDFFKKHSFKVGVSIDGPKFLHDAHRKTWKDQGTYDQTMRGIKFLQKNNIAFHTISVLTQESLKYPDELFKFFVDNKIQRAGFNVEETEGVNAQSSLQETDTEEKFKVFMQRIWELNKAAKGILKIREFERICGLIHSGFKIEKSDLTRPFSLINIDNKGNFCTYSPELLGMKDDVYGDTILGNVLTDSFESVCETEKFRRLYTDIEAGRQLCEDTCQYFSVCGGGAPSNKFWENHSFRSSETQFCRLSKKIVTDIVLEDLESSLGLR